MYLQNIKSIVGLPCTKSVALAKEGSYIKMNGEVFYVKCRAGYKGRSGYVCWSLLGVRGECRLYSWELDRQEFARPSQVEALALKTVLLTKGYSLR